MHHLSSVFFFVNQPLHVSGIFVAHHHLDVYCVYTTIGACCAFQLTVCWSAGQQSTEKRNTYQLLYIYTVYLLMMYYKYARNMIDEINWG